VARPTPPVRGGWRRSGDRQTVSRTTVDVLPDGSAAPRRIPKPALPVFPGLSLQTLADLVRPSAPSILDAAERVHVGLGREALRLVLDSIDPPPGARVLLPAYHCLSMISPVREAGLTPVFYRLTPDLHPDPDHLAALTASPACALVVVHFFGMPTPISPLRGAAEAAGARIIEDCAHAFYGRVEGRPVGTLGDYAIASSRKFFPVQAGGLAASAHRTLDERRPAPARTGSGPALLRAVAASVDEGGLPLLRPVFRLRAWLRRRAPAPATVGAAGRDGATAETPARQESSPHALSSFERMIVETSAARRHVARRRANFERYLAAFSDQPGCRPVYRTLPADCAPYLFPLWVGRLDEVFPHLEDAALPMQRFGQFPDEQAAAAGCGVSSDLSARTIQLPCHQNLSDRDILSIVTTFKSIIERSDDEK